MEMPHSQQDLIQIMANGGHLDLKVRHRTQQDLVQLAAIAKKHDARIILRDVGKKQTADLVQIAANAPAKVTFVIDD
jgi:hypothetical protein